MSFLKTVNICEFTTQDKMQNSKKTPHTILQSIIPSPDINHLP